ncbi:MAG: type II CRISPR RNA-guided endonuclease Cas9, partial [Clostridia bacterium]|nr:type II CRISPR RNA-guided endonuclease Cas9 [Clostridia bacterium]
MKNEKYYVGFDIGTDSVGYAVTDEQYNLCKYRGEPMWGVNIFEEAQLAVDRRNFRIARRRLDRRQQRIDLIRDIFAEEIYKVDKNFYKRVKESYLYPNATDEKVRLFDSYGEQKSYNIKYPTIHHLIFELMQSNDIHDVRLVYIACAWLVAHRGHFLSDVSKNNIEEVTDFGVLYKKLVNYIKRDGRILPWNDNIDIDLISSALKIKTGITKKAKAITEVLFNGEKAPKVINDEYEFNYELLIKLLCGAKVGLKELFGREEYEDLDEKSIMLGMDDEKLAAIMQNIGDDADIINILKSIYDWAILIDVLKGKTSISEAKVEVYEQHKRDLKSLKYFIKKYLHEKYDEIFRSKTQSNNYVAYIGKNKTKSEDIKVKKSNSKEDLCKYLLSIFKNISPDTEDFEEYQRIINSLEINDFLPKQVDGDNRVIPFQLYLYELNKILENAQSYLSVLSKKDENGLTGVQKILSVFEFRVPYYVGPLKENPENNKKINCWMQRKAVGKIYPWNFKDMVDLDASEELFIKRMTNSCTYLPGEDVLPKNSLIYCAFEVLNEINKIKINGVDI